MAFNKKELLYKLQFQRGLSPSYIFFTKQGFFLFLLVLYMTFSSGTTLKMILGYAAGYWAIYKFYFPYKYTEAERVWLIHLWNNFTTHKIAQPRKSMSIFSWDEILSRVEPQKEPEQNFDLDDLAEREIRAV